MMKGCMLRCHDQQEMFTVRGKHSYDIDAGCVASVITSCLHLIKSGNPHSCSISDQCH